MSFAGTAALGAVAGFTIFLGLPIARLGRPSVRVMAFVNAAAVGVLLFLLFDVVSHANDSIEAALTASRPRGIGDGFLFGGGVGVGLLGLIALEAVMKRRSTRGSERRAVGAMAASALPLPHDGAVVDDPATRTHGGMPVAARVSLSIAIGIGLHNFSEGLAIGQSGRLGLYQLFGVLVIGFGLHNVTEGFGISGPLVGAGLRPSWSFLALLGLVGGGPTLIGTLVGYQTTSNAMSVLFLALAAGAIIYVVGELQHVGRRLGAREVATVGLLVGFLVAYATDKLLFVLGG
jgi:ZIP family zinc transporter